MTTTLHSFGRVLHTLTKGKLLTLALAAGAAGLTPSAAFAEHDRDRYEGGRREDRRDDRRDRDYGRDLGDYGRRDGDWRDRGWDDHGRRGRKRDVEVNVDIIRGRPPRDVCPPRYEERRTRVWVEPVYKTVCDRVWKAPVYETVVEQVWVPARYEERRVVRYRHGCRVVVCERVEVCAGHYETRTRQVETCAGRWETVERQELVCAGHWDYKVERVPCDDGYGRDSYARFDLEFGK